MEKVSVIIPTYNRAQFLERAVVSVIRQENFEGELIIVDDGSTDNTGEVIDKISKTFELRYIKTDNLGPSAARNKGVELSRYPFLAFLDSDDHWHSEKISRQLKQLKDNPEYDISHTGEKWLRRGKHLNKKKFHYPRQGYIFPHCLQLCAVGMSTVMMKKSLFLAYGGFDTEMPCCEDYDFWIRVSSRHEFLLLPEALTVKEGGRPDQLSYQYRVGIDRFRIYALQKLLDNTELTAEQFGLALAELEKKCQVYGNGCIKHGEREKGMKYLKIPEYYHSTVARS